MITLLSIYHADRLLYTKAYALAERNCYVLSIDHILLGLISLEPCSGYDMKLEIEKGIVGMLSSLSFGSIYPHLKHLEQEGLVEILPGEESGRQKKLYELTPAGWGALAEWLEKPNDYPLPMRDPLLLKMLFWGSSGMDRLELREHLQQRQVESMELLQYMMEWQRDGRAFIDE